ncbi:M24 family metallopeptidase [Candidatus Margulisiibacteriota bacterium]
MISIKTEDEIGKIRVACVITAEVRDELIKLVRSGITTKEIDSIAENLIREKNAIPAFKGYRGYGHTG